MNEPIKFGDKCVVVNGMTRHKSPNIGKLVTVGGVRGEHSVYGRVFRCEGEGVVQLDENSGEYVQMNWADFPACWLQKVPPNGTEPAIIKEERELHVD